LKNQKGNAAGDQLLGIVIVLVAVFYVVAKLQ